MQLDLASFQSVRSFAEEFLRSEPRLDLLINNAGQSSLNHVIDNQRVINVPSTARSLPVWSSGVVNRGRTEDGFGLIFGVNHLGHFLLTALLLERLRASGRSRVVTVASKAYSFGRLDFGCLAAQRDLVRGSGDFSLFQSYACSKLCNVLFTHELAKRLQGSEVTCYSLHPGQYHTPILSGRGHRLSSVKGCYW